MEKVLSVIKNNIGYIIIIILVLLFKAYVASPIKVNGNSMYDTLENNDIMILNEIVYRFSDIKRFDIVVIKTKDEYLIKRVIGLPGEKLLYRKNKLYINGVFVKENFNHKETDDFETTVPKGKYFVLGDNRVNSADSRVYGAFSKKEIKGKTSLIIYPFNRIGFKY